MLSNAVPSWESIEQKQSFTSNRSQEGNNFLSEREGEGGGGGREGGGAIEQSSKLSSLQVLAWLGARFERTNN